MSSKTPADIMFSPTVKKWQAEKGSRLSYEKMAKKGGFRDTITPDLIVFLGQRDSFYFGTASPDGQPYIQHRGGKPGFLKVLDEKTLAFADFRGNKQYISSGNLEDNPKAYIFLMDYANRRRIKIWGEAQTIEDDPGLLKKVLDDDSPGTPERVIIFTVTAWDINCPKHIPKKFNEEEIKELVKPLLLKIQTLEEELNSLRENF